MYNHLMSNGSISGFWPGVKAQYVPDFDVREAESIGWFVKNIDQIATVRSDDRFRQ